MGETAVAKSSRYSSKRYRLNNRIMWLVAGVIFLAPAFYGSNRPALWLIWSAVMGIGGAVYFAVMASSGTRFRFSPRTMPTIFILFAAMAGFMVVQLIPFGSLVPAVNSVAGSGISIQSATISLTPGDSFLALVRWCTYGLIFFLILQLASNQQRAASFLKLIYWGIVIHAILGMAFLLQFGDTILGIRKISYLGSATGGFVNRNSFATYLAFGAILGANLIMARFVPLPPRTKGIMPVDTYLTSGGVVPIICGWLIIVWALIATSSRMGVFAAGCGIAFSLLLFLSKKNIGMNRAGRLAITYVLPLVMLLLVVGYGSTLIERFGDVERHTEIRWELYNQILGMIGLRPLVGYGGNSFEYVYPLFHLAPVNFDLVWNKAHSTYLALWVEYGILFGSVPLAIVSIIFMRIAFAYFAAERQDVALQTGLAVILAGAVHSLVDFSLEIEAVTFVFVALLAVAWVAQSGVQPQPEDVEP